MLVFGEVALGIADVLRRATATGLEPTRERLRDEAGEVLCEVAEVARVERGPFAFKPSNRFLIVLGSAPGRRWAPGLKWRIGRRIGVGGVTSKGEAKAMADILAALVAERG
jgi:hypothetical protein